MKAEKNIIIVGAILLVIGVVLSMINISADNAKKEIIINAISMFLIGLGSVILAIGALKFLQKKK